MIKKILFACLFISVSSALFAQRDKGEMVVGFNVGYSLTGGLFNALDFEGVTDTIDVGSISTNALPALSLTFDIGVSEKVSFGVMYSFQRISGDIQNYSFVNEDGMTQTESINFGLNRNNISLLPRFHWDLGNDNLDLYTGLRIGYMFWNGNVETTDDDFDEFDGLIGSRPNFGLVPIGFRGYFTENLGANFEIAIGAPYIVSAGAQYRF